MRIFAFMNTESFKNIDQPVGLRYLVRPLSRPLAWIFDSIGIGPNTVTLFRGIGTFVIFLFILLYPEEMSALWLPFYLLALLEQQLMDVCHGCRSHLLTLESILMDTLTCQKLHCIAFWSWAFGSMKLIHTSCSWNIIVSIAIFLPSRWHQT